MGETFELEGDDLDANTTRIMSAIVDLLPPEAREKRTPTPEELARTYPSGIVPDEDATDEHTRRPGRD